MLQENHYYPFSVTIAPLSQSPENGENKYPYNGKEHHADFGLHWTDYEARWSDAQLGRWHRVDPLAESFLHESTYIYAGNNPVYFIAIEGKYKYTAEFTKEYSENYSCVRRYLENYIQKDVLASNTILETFLYSFLNTGDWSELKNCYINRTVLLVDNYNILI